MSISRRQALLAGSALPLAAALPISAAADGHAAAAPKPLHSDFSLGDFRVTTLLVGSRPVDNPNGIFGLSVDAETFASVSEENFIPSDSVQFFFTPTVVNTGSEVILFDAGLNAEGTTNALAAAGYSADDITHLVITHMHGDHIGGLSDDGGNETFANASYIANQQEFDHWAGADNGAFEGKVRPLADKLNFIGDGGAVASGVTGMAAFGHTPGHMVYMLESGGEQLMIIGDLANHPVYSLAYPDWEVRFDIDKAAAAASRRNILGMLAAERMPMIGHHMPALGLGYVAPPDDGLLFVPHSYLLL